MSTDKFIKGECRHCAGHLEFPAHAAGETIACPHCGRPTLLVPQNATAKSNRRWLLGFFAGVILVGGLAAYFSPAKKTSDTPVSPKPADSVLIVKPAPPADFLRTNDFALSPFKLEQTSGSSLVYVVGTLRNLTARQRFGVKLEFGLLDANGQPLGRATDYNRQMEPHALWAFKALVWESKAKTARLEAINEIP